MKKYFAILCGMFVCACGFQPMFVGKDADIYVAPISGINGIELRNELNSQFGGQHRPDSKYVLTIKLNNPVTKYKALERTGDATWQEVLLTAKYELKCGDETIISGSESAGESYTFVRYLVAANASYNNAVQNTIGVLAEKIGTRTIAATHQYESKHNSGTH